MDSPYHPYNDGKILLNTQVHSFGKRDLAWPKSLHLTVQKITLLDLTGRNVLGCIDHRPLDMVAL